MEQSLALPSEWIARLFERFRAIYGNRLDQMFGAADPQILTATWAQELSTYAPDDLRKALEATALHYKDFPPTLYQFADLCREAKRARAQSAVKLVNKEREPMPAEVREALSKFMRRHVA